MRFLFRCAATRTLIYCLSLHDALPISELLSGTDPTTVFRLIAEEAGKLTGADAALVAIPLDEDTPEAEVHELLVVETVGAAMASIAGDTIPVAELGRAHV